MPLAAWHLLLQTPDILAVSERAFYLHAAVNPWTTGLVFTITLAMVCWLYRAQQRIASPRLVGLLTAIRVLLLLSMLVLLLQPAFRWTHRDSSAGTLWLLLDSTGSMATTDPQSSPAERLRWAEALEYLPENSRPVKLDQTVAQLVCLRDDLSRLRSTDTFQDQKAPVEQFTNAMTAWRKLLNEAVAQLTADAKVQPAASMFATNLQQTGKLTTDAIRIAAEGKSLADAIKAIPWNQLETDLDLAIKILTPMADRADAEFLKSHANDAPIKTAMASAAKLTRSQLAWLDLTQKASRMATSLEKMLPAYHVRIASFTDKVRSTSIDNTAGLPEAIQRAMSTNGQATNLSAALRLVVEQSTPGQQSSVLILSDGRQNVEGDAPAVARQLAAQGVPVYALGIGSSQIAIDAAVESMETPDWVYKDDTVRASARILANGLAGKEVAVEFWRDAEKLDTKLLHPGKSQDIQIVTFEDPHPKAGTHAYRVNIPHNAGEENDANNHQSARVAVKQDRLKMLIVEDQPRWEYRHLVSYLSRDPRVKLQTVLLKPTKITDVSAPTGVKASTVNPKTEAQVLPQTKVEWLAFDVVMLGDVSPADLPVEQQKNLASAVKDGGKAMIVIAGPRNMPGGYLNAPLAEILPVMLSGEWTAETLAAQLKTGFTPSVTPEGSASILSQLKFDTAENAAAWSSSPAWFWHSEQTQAKPAATVLWSIETAGETGGPEMNHRRALLATSSVGTGRVMYLASDQTWRWRQVNGENLQERFWGQTIRWAVGNDLPAGGIRAKFGVDKPNYVEGESVIVNARLLREDLTPLDGQSFDVIAKTNEPSTSSTQSTITGQAHFVEVPESPGQYRATIAGLRAGEFELSLGGDGMRNLLSDVTDEKQKTLSIQVQAQLTVEQRDINTDKPKLAEIAKAGGGIMLDGPYASVLAKYIPRPTIEQTSIEQLGFFGDPTSRYTKLTHWIFLGIFCLLITAEWVIRKAVGLV